MILKLLSWTTDQTTARAGCFWSLPKAFRNFALLFTKNLWVTATSCGALLGRRPKTLFFIPTATRNMTLTNLLIWWKNWMTMWISSMGTKLKDMTLFIGSLSVFCINIPWGFFFI